MARVATTFEVEAVLGGLNLGVVNWRVEVGVDWTRDPAIWVAATLPEDGYADGSPDRVEKAVKQALAPVADQEGSWGLSPPPLQG